MLAKIGKSSPLRFILVLHMFQWLITSFAFANEEVLFPNTYISVYGDRITLIITNENDTNVQFADSINFRNPNRHLNTVFQLAPTKTKREDRDISDWIYPGSYRSFAVEIPNDPITLKPGEFGTKSWSIYDLISPHVTCSESEHCTYFVRFRVVLLQLPPQDLKQTTYSPWFEVDIKNLESLHSQRLTKSPDSR